jgi:hypothetical protein
MPEVAEPLKTQREGSRWRYARPTPQEVSEWFKTQPLDEGMRHEEYESGVVIIPASEKVKKQRSDGRGTEDVYEMTFTPYMRVDMRVLYFRRLAERRRLKPVIEPVPAVRIDDTKSAYFNGNLGEGLWWHVVRGSDGAAVRYLAATWRVALYEPHKLANDEGAEIEGVATKQVAGGADINGIMKAETGAIGRALAAAGILVLGTGLASAEDMQDLASAGPAGGVEPLDTGRSPAVATDPEEERKQLIGRPAELEATMRARAPESWTSFAAWWDERKRAEGWANITSVPTDALRGIIVKMERELDAALHAQANLPTAGAS